MADWDFTFDLVVVGSGGAGLTAAIVARDRGLSAVVLEKQRCSVDPPRCQAAVCGSPIMRLCVEQASLIRTTRRWLTYRQPWVMRFAHQTGNICARGAADAGFLTRTGLTFPAHRGLL